MKRAMLGGVAAACCAVALVATAAPAQGGESKPGSARASIVGGGVVDVANWPFVAAIFRKGRLHCGASVIAPTKVLTAAHCVLGFDLSNFAVVIGRSDLRAEGTGTSIAVTTGVVHPDYPNSGIHDMAVLTLAQPTTAMPVALISAAEDAAASAPGMVGQVAGWGARNPFGFRLSRFLKSTIESVRDAGRCLRAYSRDLFHPEAMICALGKRIGRFGRPPLHSSACTGDSGGPLVASTPTGPKQIGIVSFGGAICGIPGAPTVYSRVASGLDFLAAS
jgi:trypsin